MYVSLKWLHDIINIKEVNFSKVCEKLTLSGFEIDNIIEKKILNEIDYILDVNITANRNDLFNVIGIAREIASLSGKSLMKINQKSSEFASWQYFIQNYYFFSKSFNLSNQLSYSSVLFTVSTNNFVIQESPRWIKKKLISSEFLPINNIIDISNFILLETGYLFTLYDKTKLQKFVNSSQLNFTTKLNYPTNILTSFKNENNLLLLLVNEIPVEIIGLSQVSEVSITKATTEIIIQAGLFNLNQMPKTSSYLGVKTESFKKLEKDLNPNGFERAFIRLIYLFFTQGIYFKVFLKPNCFKVNLWNNIQKEFLFAKPRICLSYKSINKILGNLLMQKKINKQKIFTSLNHLNFKILNINSRNCIINVPYARLNDISKEIDLLEEIARIIGFNNFLSRLPFSKNFGKLSKLEKLKRHLKSYFLSIGLNEILNYTLTSKSLQFVPKLKNPIVNELINLRSNLLENLLEKLKFNQNQGNLLLDCFEINRIYKYNGQNNLIEEETITGFFGEINISSNWQQTKTYLNWFEAKGLLTEIFLKLELNLNWFDDKKKVLPIFYPGKFSHLFFDQKHCGYFGQINPSYAQKLNIPKTIYLFDLNLSLLEKIWQPNYFFLYKPYSIYPKSIVDLSIILPNNISFKAIQTYIYYLQDPVLKSVYLFDFYSDFPIPKGYNSFGLKLQFQSYEKTLTNLEVEKKIKNIKVGLTKTFNIIFRY